MGAYGGKKEIMGRVSPAGDIYQAGTLSGNPLAMRAGLETLKLVREEGFYEKLEQQAALLEEGLRQNMKRLGVDYYMTRVGSMGCLFFNEQPVYNYRQAKQCDTQLFARYFQALLEAGVYVAPSQFEAFFLSAAHGEAEVAFMTEAHEKALRTALNRG